MDWTFGGEPWIRLAVFFAVFAAVALWELAAPFRTLTLHKPRRWARNLGLVAIDTLLVRLLLPAGAVGMAWYAAERGWGLFHVIDAPDWLAVLVCVVVLDLVIYLQHVVFHAVPALWRLHMVHHADLDFDLTTGTRFHPVEILLSMVIKLAAVAVLGAPALAVLIFEALLNATAMFNHANVHLPPWLDRPLRWMVVTPDMHRVHHSVKRAECNSNFGFNLPWWDRLLGTYVPDPAAGQGKMRIGVSHIRDRNQSLPWMLGLPFRRCAGAYPFGIRPTSATDRSDRESINTPEPPEESR